MTKKFRKEKKSFQIFEVTLTERVWCGHTSEIRIKTITKYLKAHKRGIYEIFVGSQTILLQVQLSFSALVFDISVCPVITVVSSYDIR